MKSERKKNNFNEYDNNLNNMSKQISELYLKFVEIIDHNINKCCDSVELLNLVLELMKYEENIKL